MPLHRLRSGEASSRLPGTSCGFAPNDGAGDPFVGESHQSELGAAVFVETAHRLVRGSRLSCLQFHDFTRCRKSVLLGKSEDRGQWPGTDESDLAFQRRRYERRKKAGICVKCGKYPQQETNVRCGDCQEEHYARKVSTRATNRKASRKTSTPVRKARIDARQR